MNFITSVNRASYNLILVTNSPLDPEAKSEALRRSCLLIERDNVGRDFGAYKDGIKIAFERFPNIERLIIANDSVYYLENGLDGLITSLTNSGDFTGISETFQHHYHVASFLMSFGPTVLKDPAFHKFWQMYRPMPSRMWAILKGEGTLTQSLVAAGHRPHILFRAEDLLPKLRQLVGAQRTEFLALLPRNLRKPLAAVAGHASADEFAKAVLGAILQCNQMHATGFAFMKFLGIPLFKRDIVYRELYSVAEVRRIIAELEIGMQTEIAADLARRTPPARANVLKRALFEQGFA